MAVKKGEGTHEVVFSRVTIPRWGESIEGWLTRPEDRPAPGLLVAPGPWGITGFVEAFCHRLSRQGYTCLAVEPYSRGAKPRRTAPVDEAARAYTSLPEHEAVIDLRAGLEFMMLSDDAKPSRIGMLAFGPSGLHAAELGLGLRTRLRGLVLYWASLPPDDVARRLACPVLGLYGAQDDSVPADAVQAFGRAVGPKAEILVYPTAGPLFADDERDTFDAATADDAWTRTLAFLQRHLS